VCTAVQRLDVGWVQLQHLQQQFAKHCVYSCATSCSCWWRTGLFLICIRK
jgi:hypothetical protein